MTMLPHRWALPMILLGSVICSTSSLTVAQFPKNPPAKTIPKTITDNPVNGNQKTMPEWLLDIPYSPVKMTVAEAQDNLFFDNRSDKEISEIRVGVVKSENKKFKVLSKKSFVKINGKLPSGQIQFAGMADYLKDIDSALEKRAKLAVIIVKFSDGSDWQLRASGNSDQQTVLPDNIVKEASPLKFEPLFIRFMTEAELKKQPHSLDPDLLIKYRVTNVTDRTIYYYTNFLKEDTVPSGNTVKENGWGIVWLIYSNRTESPKSPGLTMYSHGGWIKLAPGASVEWEELEISTPKTERHARTMFIKFQDAGPLSEVLSDFYTVPEKKNESSAREINPAPDPDKEEKVSPTPAAENVPPLKFALTSIRFMTEEEKEEQISTDTDLLVRYSLSNLSDQTIYLYSWVAEKIIPMGYRVKDTGNNIVWLIDGSQSEAVKSPGLKNPIYGSWVPLAPGASVEWEATESSSAELERHAASLFIKLYENDSSSTEIFSDFYRVPNEESKYWFNFPDSPLKISRGVNGRGIYLENRSEKKVIKYQLGCIGKQYGSFSIFSRRWFAVELLPVDKAGNISFVTLLETNFSLCEGRKLSVVRTVFENGTKWELGKK